MRVPFFAALLCLSVAAPSAAEMIPYFSANYFSWREYQQGRRLLKESGPLVAAGYKVSPRGTGFDPRSKLELFGGSVSYSGETQGPDVFPVSTDVNYFGVKVEADLGWKFPVRRGYFEPFGGVGYRVWLRDLQSTDSSVPNGQGELVKVHVSGYTEAWQNWYARVGGRVSFRSSDRDSFFLEAGAKHPFDNANSIKFADVGTITLHPKGRWSAFAEGGVSRGRVELALTYEGFEYAQSPPVIVTTSKGRVSLFQPDSASDIVGIRVGWRF